MDYFNDEERASQERFRVVRDKIFDYPVKVLVAIKVSPNFVSLLGVFFLIVACVLPPEHWFWIAVLLIFYVLMDGVDGPLARKLNQAHKGGAIVDMLADQMGVVLIPAAAILHLTSSGVSALLFSTGYLLLIVLVVLENELENYTQRSFVRVKYPMYVGYVISLMWCTNVYLNYMFLIAATYYWVEVLLRTKTIHKYYELQSIN